MSAFALAGGNQAFALVALAVAVGACKARDERPGGALQSSDNTAPASAAAGPLTAYG